MPFSSAFKHQQIAMDSLLLLYFLIIGNAFGERSPGLLTLTPSTPSITHSVNDSFIIFCKTTRILAGQQTQWRGPNGIVLNKTKGRIHIERKESYSLALVFEHILLEDKGNWTCEAADAKISFELLVNQKISFGNTELVQSVREGRDATVNCYVKGDPPPDVSWLYNGEYINTANSAKHKKLSDGLFIKNVTQADAGEYSCRAMQITPTFSDSDQITILLRIQHKPYWLENSTSFHYAYVGGSVNISCDAMGEPPPSFSWLHKNKGLNTRNHRVFYSDYGSTLQVKVENETAFGDYKCKVANPLGILERIFKLRKGQKPPTPTRLQVKRLLPNGFELDIKSPKTNMDETMQIFGYRVEYMSEGDFKYSAGNWSYAKFIEFSFHRGTRFKMTNLESNTTYLIRAASRNVAGLSEWSSVKIFATLANSANVHVVGSCWQIYAIICLGMCFKRMLQLH